MQNLSPGGRQHSVTSDSDSLRLSERAKGATNRDPCQPALKLAQMTPALVNGAATPINLALTLDGSVSHELRLHTGLVSGCVSRASFSLSAATTAESYWS